MRAVVLGVSGLTGRAIATEFAGAGWDVIGTGRDGSRFPDALRAHDVKFVRSDRHDPEDLEQVLAGGADTVIDCVCYTAEHARQLLGCGRAFGSAVVLSSKAVYVDDAGRHSNSDEPPRFGAAVSEKQPVLAPDYSGAFASREGYGPNKVAAEHTLLDSGAEISILRPSLIHGPGAARPREWFVVKRLLDGRRQIPLAHGGQTGNHPTELGWSPWGTWPPFFLDTAAATQLGYEPVGPYAQTVAAAVDELRSLSCEEQMRVGRDPYFTDRFDYDIDDAALQ